MVNNFIFKNSDYFGKFLTFKETLTPAGIKSALKTAPGVNLSAEKA